MAATENDIAAQLIERLLADPAFRDRFRRNPALACREAGLESLAEEMQLGGGKAMHTLDIRESRSSLAGVMMAAAMEGMGVYEFSKHVVPHLEDLSGSLGDVLSRVNLPALPGGGALSGGPEASSAAAVPPPGAEEADAADVNGSSGNGAAAAAAPAPPAPPEAAPVEEKPPAAPELAAAKGKEPAGGKAGDAASKAAGKDAAAGGEDAADGAKEDRDAAVDASGPAEFPEGPIEPKASEGGPDGAGKVAAAPGGQPVAAQPAAAPAVAEQPAAAPAAAAQPAAPSAPIDPSTLGQDGTGGSANAEAQALLTNKNVVLDDVGVADIKAGKIDPRIVGVLTKLSQEHKIVVSCMCSDHSKFTAGGSISNHAFGRGLDIASIDGEIVSPGSALAREVASELSQLDTAIRPDEIGSPFAINGPGYFTDAAHSNHIHVGFKQEITTDFKLPAEVAAGAQPAAATPAVAVAPAGAVAPELAAATPAAAQGLRPAAAAAAPAGDPKRASGLFAAVPKPAKAAAAELKAAEAPEKDSGLFAAVGREPAPQPARTADAAGAQPVAAAPVDLVGAPGAYPGDDAPKEQIAAWMAAEAQKRGLPPQLPVMAALVESNLTNVNFGDADSLGYFQMRVSIWESQYPGFGKDPEKQIDWFLDTAEGVKEQRVARGQSIDDPSQFGEWIADVERPAEQFRGRYQLRLDEANNLLADAPKTPTAPPAAPEAAAAPQPAAAVAPAPAAAPRAPIDPDQFGQEGTGGSPDAEAQALLKNQNVVLDDVGVADIKAGRIDPRIVAVLTKLSQEHKIVVSCMCSDHSRLTAGGSVSNHTFGRGLDIASIDGEIVSPSSALAREVASELSQFDQSIRPSEIGSPFAINGPAYFTDAAHSNHIHVGFDTEVAPDFVPPADLVAGAQPAAPGAVAAVAAVPGAPLAAAPAGDPKRASGLFAAVPKPAKAAAAELKAAEAPEKDSGLFAAVGREPAPQPARTADAAGAQPVAAAPVDLVGAPGAYPGDDAPKEQIAAWMAAEAQKRGLPPQLPVMAALVESNLTNVNFGDADSLGYFQMRVSIWESQYPGFGKDPEKQIDWFLDTAEGVKEQRVARGQSIDDPSQFGEWIADVERPAEQFRGRYQLRLDEANNLLADAPPTTPAPVAAAGPVAPAGPVVEAGSVGPAGGGGGAIGAAALQVAQTQRGVREVGTNTGPQVDEYLEAAGVPPGNPWCAAFVTWALQQNGHKMPGSGWAAVATWVRNAEQGSNGLELVSAEEARPGDIVAYDFGGESDFGADGHIGFLESSVEGGRFTALEGNNADAVNVVPRDVDSANVVFIRVEGDAPAGAAPIPTAAPPPGAVAAVPGAVAAAPAPPGDPKKGSGLFAAIPQPAKAAARELAAAQKPARDSGIFGALGAEPAPQGARTPAVAPDAAVPATPAPATPAAPEVAAAQPAAAPEVAAAQPAAAPQAPAAAPEAAAATPGSADAVADGAPPVLAQGPGPKAAAALKEAEKYLGTPYKWGGSTPQTGFDCSGLMQWAYAQAGVKIPRVTYAQIDATNGTTVRRGELLPGDLVFFRDPSGDVHHVGMSMGGDKFLHAPSTGDVVKVSSLDEPYYKDQFTGGRRFDAAATAGPAVAAPAGVVPAAAAPVIDPVAVASAQAAVARDAAEARQQNSSLFKAINLQEARNHALVAGGAGDRAVASATGEPGEPPRRSDSAMFLAAITPEQAAADAAAKAPPATPAVPPPVAPPPDTAPLAPEAAPPPAAAPIPDGPAPDLSDVPADYPGDNASQEALAKWLAKEAEEAGLPPELPVMAALVESGVKNLNFGDADSVGFFQMRVGIWNRGEYAGYPDNPGLQIKWFIDTALAHKKAQLARGDADFGRDPREWGEWIADVERPAEQYRGRYQLRLEEARRLLR